MEALRKQYQSLCRKFEELKTLARINLDLLFLTVNKVESPQAWVELDKVNDLVQAVLAGWENSPTSLQSDHKPPLMDIERYLDEMALSFTQQEVMDALNRFLGRSSPTSPHPDSSTTAFGNGFHSSPNQRQSRPPVKRFGSQWTAKERQVQAVLNGPDVWNVDTSPAGKTRGQKADDSKGTQITEGATLGSPPCLSDLDTCPEDNDDQISLDTLIVLRVNDRLKRTSELRATRKSPTIATKTKKKRIKTKDLLEEFGIPWSVLDPGSPKVCPTCSKEYTGKGRFLDHLKCHKREKDGAENSRVEWKSEGEPLLCTICGMTLKNRATLLGHIKLHEDKDKGEYFKCRICDKEFLGRRRLQNHMTNTHASKKSFICDVCGKEFNRKKVLKTHYESLHANIKQKCQLCNKQFYSKVNLLRHMRIHSGVLPYSCSICGKRFRYSDNKNSHEKSHTGNFPYKCTLCNHRGFISPGQLAIHQKKFHSQGQGGDNGENAAVDGKKRRTPRYHQRRTRLKLSDYDAPLEPLKCETCGKVFKNSGNLSRHKFIHTGIKPHKCQTCGRLFTTKDTLKFHMWTHSDVKQYMCDVCHRGFNDKRNYLSHIRRIHSEHTVQTPSAKQVAPNVKEDEQPNTNSCDIDETTDEAHQQLPVSVPLDV